ncbi:MAG: GNAT family N-acetyltransferase [Frankiaceae bacterium]|nr:GNAT family N-acetyltransferase [Frankiaceae bacterium]
MEVGDTVSLRAATAAGPTEVVGVVLAMTGEAVVVRRRDGSVTEIGVTSITAARVVPPGPARRISPADLERIAAAGWRALETEPLGEWVRRASGGFTARANSALAVGDPGLPLDAALDAVEQWYAARSLPPRVQAIGGAVEGALAARGWHGTGRNDVMTAEIAHVLRPLAHLVEQPAAQIDDRPGDAWLAAYRTASGPLPAVAADVLANHDNVAFLSIGAGDAIARVAVDGRWAGLFAVEVAPSARRQGLGRAVSAAALRWAVQQGARHAYLQVAEGNDGARSLYERLGFASHHHYTHWVASAGE